MKPNKKSFNNEDTPTKNRRLKTMKNWTGTKPRLNYDSGKEKVHKGNKRPATMTQKTMQSRLWQKTMNPNFLWLFLDRTKNKNESNGWIVDTHWVNRGNLIPRWYGVARYSHERRDDDDGSGGLSGITWCHRWTLLTWTLMPMQHLSNPVRYSWLHTLAHVAVDQEMVVCNLLILSGTTDHTKLTVV
jgi:hypothetical protein